MKTKLAKAPRGSGASVSVGTPVAQLRTYGNPLPYVAPWATALALWCLAVAERRLFRADEYSWYWSVLSFAVHLGLAYGAWWISRPRGRVTNVLATGGLLVAGSWTWWLIGKPPTGELLWRPHVAYWMVAILVCGCSMMWSAFKGTGDGGDRLDDLKGAVSKLRAVNEIETTPAGEILARYRMEPGTPAKDLQQEADTIAALLPGTRPDGVRVIPSRDDATAGELRISPINRLARPAPWTGPSIPYGGTAADPVRLGVRETGGWAEFWLSADRAAGRNAPIVAIVGASGSGKTELLLELLQEILSRFDCEYWYADPRKAGQMPGWVKRGAARWASGRQDTARLIRDFAGDVDERANALGAHGCRVWTPGCCWDRHGMRLRVLVVDEAAGVASDIEGTLVSMAESVRSVGAVPVLAFQRGTGDRFPTSARANFNVHICLGVQSEDDAEHGGLPEDVLDAGAQPWLWGVNEPGMHILAAPGVPAELRATSCRTFDTREAAAAMADWAERYIRAREQGTPLAAPAGDVEHRDRVPAVVDERDAEVAAMLADDLDAAGDAALADLADELEAEAHPDDLADLAATGADDEIPVPGPPPGDEVIAIQPKMSPAAARRAVYDFVRRLGETGAARQFRVADHAEQLHTLTGMKSSWMYRVAEEFCRDGEHGPAILRDRGDREPYDILTAPRGDHRV